MFEPQTEMFGKSVSLLWHLAGYSCCWGSKFKNSNCGL